MPRNNEVVMQELPDCDVCKHQNRAEVNKARYDGSLMGVGSWAYMCQMHFTQFGSGLGIGRGQRLVLPDERREAEVQLAGQATTPLREREGR